MTDPRPTEAVAKAAYLAMRNGEYRETPWEEQDDSTRAAWRRATAGIFTALATAGWGPHTEPAAEEPDQGTARPWEELRRTGLLWLINRIVFHPRGWALALVRRGGQLVGWKLQGDGREVWTFDGDEDDLFARAQATLTPPTAEGETDA